MRERASSGFSKGYSLYIKVAAAMYIITGILLFLLAVITSKVEAEEVVARIGVLVIYLVSTAAGGYIIGKQKAQRRLLWGIFAGVVYFIIALAIGMALGAGLPADMVRFLTAMCICVAGGGIGGILS